MSYSKVGQASTLGPALRSLIYRGAFASGAVTLLNGAVFGIAAALSEDGLQVTEGPGSREVVPLQLGDVLVASLAPVVPAILVWVLLHRWVSNARRLFLSVSGGVLLLSFVPVIGLPTGLATRLTLGIMHLVCATLIVGSLYWRSE